MGKFYPVWLLRLPRSRRACGSRTSGRAAARRPPTAARPAARAAVSALGNADQDEAVRAALDPALAAALAPAPPRADVTRSGPWPVEVDRERARVGAWYELFPRSWGGF